MSEWQPIETAPKDGTVVWLTDGRVRSPGRWARGFWAALQGDQNGDAWEGGYTYPTKWAPPPELPPNEGCGRKLAPGQWWWYCGETDMGQTMPVLCTECGGSMILADPPGGS